MVSPSDACTANVTNFGPLRPCLRSRTAADWPGRAVLGSGAMISKIDVVAERQERVAGADARVGPTGRRTHTDECFHGRSASFKVRCRVRRCDRLLPCAHVRGCAERRQNRQTRPTGADCLQKCRLRRQICAQIAACTKFVQKCCLSEYFCTQKDRSCRWASRMPRRRPDRQRDRRRNRDARSGLHRGALRERERRLLATLGCATW